ncbi:LLM class flavin-dependent oxidoreductase [Brucella pseudogrignonensis]|uniref:LLM class flavin-dependent oxidoreductase n=1 Tax=Brucella pseudogrignonensis TaxID=419475 RepID=UPI003F502F3A
MRALWASAADGRDINHHGEFFDISGRLRVPLSKQGQPIIFQAGGSPQGRTLADRIAEGVFRSRTDQGAGNRTLPAGQGICARQWPLTG